MISSFLEKFRVNKKTILFILLFVSLFFVFGDIVSAEGEPGFSVSPKNFEETKSTVIKVVQLLQTILSTFLALLTYLSAVFLSPEWLNGSLFGMTAYFKAIWILVSNVVYFVFAFLLVFIAFMNII
jgi:hypothetical protein